ncbi:MAG TPA: hypothetical protein VLC95_16670 [Anaerolineae bacterium]|nr:hypothetical protein [Anaerolineae bacterium]
MSQTGELTCAEFMTATHRLSGQISTGVKLLCDVLNDRSQSYLLVYNVYVSRLDDAGTIMTHAPAAYISKENLTLVVCAGREARSAERGRFSAHEYQALVTIDGFEVEGKFVGPHRLDLRAFSPANLDSFVVLTDAIARPMAIPDLSFAGEVILINRAHLESLCLNEQGST